jgi:hypothetical protein
MVAGLAAGKYLDDCLMILGITSLTGLILLLAEMVRVVRKEPSSATHSGLLICTLVYTVVLVFVVANWLMFNSRQNVVWCMLLLAPLITAGVVLPRIGAWAGAVGIWLLLLDGFASLSYDISHVDSGMWFFLGWLG